MSQRFGLRRLAILSLSLLVFCVLLLCFVGSYVFYSILAIYSPDSIDEDTMFTGVDVAWLGAIFIITLTSAAFIAIKLSRRILSPLESVIQSLRQVAEGNLHVRAISSKNSPNETSQLVDDFNSMAERLASMETQRSFWNAAIAHELRTPVTILRGRLQGLTDGVFTPDAALFQGLLHQVEGLNRLIEDLRILSLKESGHLELDLFPVNLSDDIESVVQMFKPTLEARGFSVKAHYENTRDVRCDPVRIRQALIALLENVQKHALPGEVVVSAYATDHQCCISVADSGPGIEPEQALHIFDAFHRVEPSRARHSGGTGLGLAVVKAIAEAHGGTASCQASLNHGTLLRIEWPL
ncbi:ATP-binding protein [Paenalcaligenes sp. Me131]|uniref:ATP-binding protein n=1 Tax=Paenalcaligenes sp. Me131 TaxID=3392636 RepID=UPI003D269A4F